MSDTIEASDGTFYDPTKVLTNHPDDVGPNGPDGATIAAPGADVSNGAGYRMHGPGTDGVTPVQVYMAERDEDPDADDSGVDEDPADASPEDPDADSTAEGNTGNTDADTHQV